MSVYLYLHAARHGSNLEENFLVNNDPSPSGVHSSKLDLLFSRKHSFLPETPRWYTAAYSGGTITEESFFDPAMIIRDLEQVIAAISSRDAELPVFRWLRPGNRAGISDYKAYTSVDIYENGEPCSLYSDSRGISIYGSAGRLRDLELTSSVECLLGNRNDGVEKAVPGIVHIESQSFFSYVRPQIFDLFTSCDWAHAHGLLIFPMFS